MPNRNNNEVVEARRRLEQEGGVPAEGWQVQVGDRWENLQREVVAAAANRLWEELEARRGERPLRLLRAEEIEVAPKVAPSGKRGEELFQLILSGLREIYDVEGVIAGGAVRDLAVGSTFYKDVDVFLPLSKEKFWEHYEELGWQGPPQRQPTKEYKKKEGFNCTERISTRVQGAKVDLVLIDRPLDNKDVATFPIHAQRCVWTLSEGMVLSPEARQDIEGKKFTISPTITDKDRIDRLTAKIGEWKRREAYRKWGTVVPEVKGWWE